MLGFVTVRIIVTTLFMQTYQVFKYWKEIKKSRWFHDSEKVSWAIIIVQHYMRAGIQDDDVRVSNVGGMIINSEQ